MVRTLFTGSILMILIAGPAFAGSSFNGHAEYQRDDLGYYYMITGGKFPTGNVPNGDNASGGTFRYLLDDPSWGGYPLGTWNKDDWFPENASFAVTLENGGSIVYDNNGIEDGSYGDYYDAQAQGRQQSAGTPGLYRGYSMSNNYDWIYAGYFLLTEETTIDTITGYFDPTNGFDPDSINIQYDMNIWSAEQDLPQTKPSSWVPAVDSFTGDVFSAKSTDGSFSWSDTGVDRVYAADYSYAHDDIWRLTYTLDEAITLGPGVYYFSHDAEIVPLPAAVWAGFMLLGGLAGRRAIRRRRIR